MLKARNRWYGLGMSSEQQNLVHRHIKTGNFRKSDVISLSPVPEKRTPQG